MGRREYAQRSTLYDLYKERSAVGWYFRVLATIGTCMILAAYILLAFAATPNPQELVTKKAAIVAAGIVLLVLGVSLTTFTYLSTTSLFFRFDVILVPTIISSSIGFLAVLLNQKVHQKVSFHHTLVYLPILFAVLGVLLCTTLALWTNNRIRKVRDSDIRTRERVIRSQDALAWRPESVDSSLKLLPDLPDDELQRQQLERLLYQQSAHRAPSPEAQSNTYRIDLPSPLSPDYQRHLAVPTNTGRARSQSAGNIQERSTWQLQNLKNLLPGKRQTNRADRWKDPREKRREEIERAGYDQRTAMLRMPANPHGTWNGSPLISPPTHSPAYRYA